MSAGLVRRSKRVVESVVCSHQAEMRCSQRLTVDATSADGAGVCQDSCGLMCPTIYSAPIQLPQRQASAWLPVCPATILYHEGDESVVTSVHPGDRLARRSISLELVVLVPLGSSIARDGGTLLDSGVPPHREGHVTREASLLDDGHKL